MGGPRAGSRWIGGGIARFSLGGFVFLVVFACAYSLIDESLYAVRDDGVITLSHARNLIENGFIGVGPSGERVEGYSTPLQFALGLLFILATGKGYAAYAGFQTVLGTFLLGGFWTWFFRGSWRVVLLTSAAGSRLQRIEPELRPCRPPKPSVFNNLGSLPVPAPNW